MRPSSDSISNLSSPRSPIATVLAISATLSCILCVPALVTHIKCRNLAASALMISIVIGNLFTVVNSLIWGSENPTHWWNGVGLCDVEVKLDLYFSGLNVGAAACIFRRLAIILDTDRSVIIPNSAHRRLRGMFELGFCFLIPTYLMIAHYLIQPSRYSIYLAQGCVPSIYTSWVSILLVPVWPLLLSIVATVYGASAVYRLVKYRSQFAVILSSSQSCMSQSHFLRLFALSTALILIYFPLAIFTFWLNTSFAQNPYSWQLVHPAHWSQRIDKIPELLYGGFDKWIQISTGFLAFLFFGLGADATALYKGWLQKFGVFCTKKASMASSGNNILVGSSDNTKHHSEVGPVSDSQQNRIVEMPITFHEDETFTRLWPREAASSASFLKRPGVPLSVLIQPEAPCSKSTSVLKPIEC